MNLENKQCYVFETRHAELASVADKVASLLRQSQARPFVLWLQGELGAGKTTFTGFLLHALGLPQSVPVLSPTYAYLTEYETACGLCAHIDLYRLVDGGAETLETLLSGRAYAGIIVEWPLRAADSPYISRTHEIRFDFGRFSDERRLQLEVFV